MKPDKDIAQLLAPNTAPRTLRIAIVERIARAELVHARVAFALSSVVALLSGMALVPVTMYTASQFASSGFASYASLAFSDTSLMATYWREFSLSLIESLPSLALLMALPLAVALVVSVRSASRTAKSAFRFS